MDVGVWMSAQVLEHKLQAREEDNTEQAWNLSRWPAGFTAEGQHRLFVATGGAWSGYLILSPAALFSPDDPSVPFTLSFDTCSWTPVDPVPTKRFRGFTYKVRQLHPASRGQPETDPSLPPLTGPTTVTALLGTTVSEEFLVQGPIVAGAGDREGEQQAAETTEDNSHVRLLPQ